ncbi:hypothetical protein SAMN05421542_1865 [Chryseobacterium jejuense]|uniref:Uncharacterized protein n=1 Tax=Chryseobacterium jejuense TaxID=445960 RepID=A0A2X2VLS3_CHRJE|nr:hypothetical protein SAMN05421542_1865 [Chryseobacterium jejuense]SQB27777.1 Uncharacterised protein [Chryseobacterium jejuense]
MFKILLLLSMMLLFSCHAQTKKYILSENYSSLEEPSEYNLQLKSDSTFVYKIGFKGSLVAKCKGKWTYIKKADSIRLYCETESALESLTNTYMSERINSFKIMKKGKVLRNKKIILKSK